MFERIISLGYYCEGDARQITANILKSIEFVHQKGVVHRVNFIFNSRILNRKIYFWHPKTTMCKYYNFHRRTVKLADFGLSTFFDEKQMLSTYCGTLTYCAPEILKSQLYGMN